MQNKELFISGEKGTVACQKEDRDVLYDVLSGSVSFIANEVIAETEHSDDAS